MEQSREQRRMRFRRDMLRHRDHGGDLALGLVPEELDGCEERRWELPDLKEGQNADEAPQGMRATFLDAECWGRTWGPPAACVVSRGALGPHWR